jgi:hypothetical protein
MTSCATVQSAVPLVWYEHFTNEWEMEFDAWDLCVVFV